MYKIENLKREYLAMFLADFYTLKRAKLTKKEGQFLEELEVVVNGIVLGKGGKNV